MSNSVPVDAGIYVAGHRGLVGSAITRQLRKNGYNNLLLRTRAELDLTDQREVRDFFAAEKPDFVFLAAAEVGGILANYDYPAGFIQKNLAIQTNVLHEAWANDIKRLIFLGSSCIYPRDCPQPIREEYLLTGPLESTNRPYALAKIAGVEMCSAYNRQYGTEYLAVMPANVYGPGDNYDPETAHVLPALIRKMHEARVNDLTAVTLWGTGRPRREFIHSEDLGRICVELMNLSGDKFAYILNGGSTAENPPLINIGTGKDIPIAELARLIARIVGFEGELKFDTGKPDGTPRKLLDSGRLHALGIQARIEFAEGLRLVYEDFVEQIDKDKR